MGWGGRRSGGWVKREGKSVWCRGEGRGVWSMRESKRGGVGVGRVGG